MRRLNVKLALWLVGITIFSVVGVHFLHGYQLDRNANFLKVQAEQAREAGDTNEAIKKYNQYLRHRDDREGYQALAELVVAAAKEPDATPRDKFRAYTILEEAIRRHEDLDGVRASLIDYTMMMRRFADAIDHIEILHDHGNNDPELEYKTALCHFYSGEKDDARKKLFEIVGYDPITKQFAVEPPATAKEVEAFVFLSQLLRSDNQPEVADAVMQQLVTWNPDSSEAHLALGRDLLTRWQAISDELPDAAQRKEELLTTAKAEFDKAFKLAPDDADTLLAVATAAMLESDFDKAQELLDRARKEHPDRQEVYVRLSELALSRGDASKATEELQAGLKESSNVRRILEQLVEVQFQVKDFEAVRATCKRMREVDAIPPEFIRYQEARLKLAEGNVIEATRDFEQVRPAMERLSKEYGQRVNSLLAQCYQQLGLPDRQLEIYEELLRSYPNLLVARLGQATALQSLGRHNEAGTAVALLVRAAESYPAIRGAVLQIVINQELSKPQDERNWEAVDKIAGMLYEDPSRPAWQNSLLKAELLMVQDRDQEAREILVPLRKEAPKEVSVWLSLCKLLARDEKTRDQVPRLLDYAEREVGDVAALRLQRLQAILRAGGENTAQELKKMEQGIDKFSEAEQQSLLLQLGFAYLRTGDYAGGQRCWKKVLATDPKNAHLRQLMFEAAQENKDDAGMQQIVKDMADSPYFGPQSTLYIYCDASRRLQNFSLERKGKSTPLTEADHKVLADVRQKVDQAIGERNGWAPLYRVRAEVEQLQGNVDGAIDNYQRSLRFSRVRQGTVARRLVTLLYASRRFAEANEALKYLSDAEIPDEMRQMVEDAKIRSGDSEAALKMAREDIQEHPDSPTGYIRYGQILDSLGHNDEAEQAYRKATEVGPELALSWDLLVRRLMGNRKKNEAVEAARAASKSLSTEPLAVARLFQRVDDLERAEQLYLSALKEKPNDLATLHQVAEFYVASNRHDVAMKYLDQMIGQEPSSDSKATAEVNWARRRKAACLALRADYHNVMAAVNLIQQNEEQGKLARVDMLGIIELLRDRPEHTSRVKAIEIFEQLRKTGALSPRQMAALSQLYEHEGRWQDAKNVMLSAVNSGSNDIQVLLLFTEMLLNHDDADEAERFMDRAEELIAKSTTAVPPALNEAAATLRAQLLVRDGEKDRAAALMEGLLSRPLPQNQLPRLGQIARRMEKLGLLEATERLLVEYMEQDVRGAIALAAFRGRQGNVEEAFRLLTEARKNQTAVEILSVAMETLRYYPKEVTKERCQMLEEWAKSALETEANKDRIKLLLAELYDLQGRYDEVVEIYRAILADPEAGLAQKAVAQNNLAFVLAAINPTPERASEALELINASIQILGPRADLLDTRAVAYLALGNTDKAAADVRIAAADVPSVAKYYHLAQIEKRIGNTDAARDAMAKAMELHGDHNPFTPAERKGFEALQQQLN